VIELLPLNPAPISAMDVSQRYREGYLQEFAKPLELREDAKTWGAPEDLTPKAVRLRERQAREVLHLLRGGQSDNLETFCDLSAGAGHCTFEAAKEYPLVFHCDLSADAIAYASAKADRLGVANIVFVRSDYLQLPIRNTIQHLTCLDTLIRGRWHETKLLTSLCQALAPGGRAAIDFHNWWHNPLRRLGLFQNNFEGNRSYSHAELQTLLANAGIQHFQVNRFVQEVDPAQRGGKLLSWLIPPTRFLVCLSKPAEARVVGA
jgi:SAM-dependent methyltransferase